MIGPIVLTAAGAIAGWFTAGWGGLAGGLLAAVALVAAVAAGAAVWAGSIGRHLEVADARRLAPRPPGFGRLCDAVYRRALGGDDDAAVG